ncbi:MAG: hypothetical protein JJ902_05400 [Roseibium sp.]|nr:hypothetical protein [Roseibium sp.]
MTKRVIPEQVGSAELARLLGVTTRRLNQLVDEGVIAKEGRGKFPVHQNVKAFIAFKLRTEFEKAAPSALERVQERREQLLARKLARDDRDTITLSEAIDVLDDVVGRFLQSLSGLPARISRDINERRRIEEILDAERDSVSRDFAKSGQALRTGITATEVDPEDDI